ncbi:hypothetical protein FIBSPDRAFT_1041104 [Athelia psychrophila]|uniref:DUF6534 domain-containing protein n=1 Tax=Athelia psychrophila TaxID=1759441 RepID=A0A166PFX0_9AGAM|nr:hypothetical protein FIBSPDRAFT_1041104 [Fibularhizoctonia sp. CBS 109695]
MPLTQVESASLNVSTHAPIGPAFIGFVISLSLHGISIAQTIFYYRHFPHDGKAKKLIVFVLNLADLAQTAVLSNTFWMLLYGRRFVGADGNATRISPDLSLWQLEVCYSGSYVIAAFIMAIVQGVWRVSCKNVALVAAITITSLVQMGALIYIDARCDEVMGPQSVASYLISLPFVANIACDGAIAGSLTYYFRSYRLGMPRTEPVMQQLIWLSMGTGLTLCVTTAFAWALSLFYGSASFIGPLFVVGKLYVNSMMANINSRKHFRAVVERTIDYSMHTSAFDTSKFATE